MSELLPYPVSKILSRIVYLVRNRRTAFAAFLVPFIIRGIPEIIAGPFPLGWDVVTNYVPTTLDLVAGRIAFDELLGTSPLIYLISGAFRELTRLDPIWIFKVMGPFLYGSMCVSLYSFLRASIKWNQRSSLVATLFLAFYFVTLRLSWDLYRTVLGLTFVLLALPLLVDVTDRRKSLALGSFLVLAVLSEQLIGLVALSLVVVRVVATLRGGKRTSAFSLLKVGTPAFISLIAVTYAHWITDGPVVAIQSIPPNISMIGSNLGFLALSYLPIFPFALIGIRRFTNSEIKWWAYCCAGGFATQFIPFFGSVVQGYRWVLLADIPICLFAITGMRMVSNQLRCLSKDVQITQRSLRAVLWIVLITVSALYIALPAQQAVPLFSSYPMFMPSSMIQSTVPLADMQSVHLAVSWISEHSTPQVAVITHQAFYGWIRMFSPGMKNVINYGYTGPLAGLALAQEQGYSQAFMIWWLRGGWYGQNVPRQFAPAFVDGNIAVFTSSTSLLAQNGPADFGNARTNSYPLTDSQIQTRNEG